MLTGSCSTAAFVDVRVDGVREEGHGYRKCKQNDCRYPACFDVRHQLAINPYNHGPVQNDMQYKQCEEHQCDNEVNRSPLMAVQAPEIQFNIAAVDIPSLIAWNKHVPHQKADSRDRGNAEQQQSVNDKIEFRLFHNYSLSSLQKQRFSYEDTVVRLKHAFVRRQILTSISMTGTSIRTPTTVAKAAPEESPNNIVAVAIATSK